MDKSHLTAIKRKKISLPMRWLIDNGHINSGDDILDYGCGRGYDADELEITGYDPYYRPELPDRKFDIVTCNYVLNVIEDPQERLNVETELIFRARKKAFVSVRNDVHALNGCTSKGTWQGVVDPQYGTWNLLEENSKFKLWVHVVSTECEGM
jgi:DNA phosphorothioation-associated putative methyltransferase